MTPTNSKIAAAAFLIFTLAASSLFWFSRMRGSTTEGPQLAPGHALSRADLDVFASNEETLDAAIDAAISYIIRADMDDGHFVYRINLDGHEVTPRYNVLRHGGVIYGMNEALEMHAGLTDQRRQDLRAAIVRSAHYLKGRYLGAPKDLPKTLAVFSRPDEEDLDGNRPQAKLGGTALGLVALLAAHRIDADVASTAELRRLGGFIVSMQNKDGTFQSTLDSNKNDDSDFVSLYYPGEAILALVRLSKVDDDPEWIQAAERGIMALIDSRKNVTDLPADHWLMIAMAELMRETKVADEARAKMIGHGKQLAESMMAEQKATEKSNPKIAGSFMADGRCSPTATRLEGMTALLPLLTDPKDAEKRKEISVSVLSGAKFLLGCQARHGRAHGSYVRAIAKRPDLSEDFNDRQAEVRIDYVQHALSALLGARYAL